MKRKILSLALVFALVISLLPAAAQAAGVTVNITGHTAGNLGAEIDAYMSANGILSYSDITGLSVSGGTINNDDRVFLYNNGIHSTLKTVDFSGTSIDYSGAVSGGHFPADNPNELPKYAFGNWTAMTSIKLPDSVTNIAEWAFSNCPSLATVYLPSGLDYIDNAVFYNSSVLKDVYTNSATPPTFLHSNAFMNVADDAVIHVPDGSGSAWDSKDWDPNNGKIYQLRIENLAPIITHMQTRTSDTTAEITVSSDEPGSCYYAVVKDGETAPAIDTSGAGEAFNASNSLTISLTGLEPGAYDIYLKAKDLPGNVSGLNKIDLEAYVPPVDVFINNHETGKLADEIDGYLNSLGIPNRYEKIHSLKVSGGALDSDDWDVFYNYYGMAYALQSIDFSGTSSQSIPDYTFEDYNMTDISLPSGIESIGAYSFGECGNLADVTIPSSTPPTVGADAFYGMPSGAAVHVPTGSAAAYKAVDDGDTTDDLWYGLVVVAPDTTLPSIINVTPTGTGVSISGNIVITFNEAMDTSAAGTVLLDGGSTSLTGGNWSSGNTVYTIPYSGLSYSKQYTIAISGFEDAAGNTMAIDSAHSFTTRSSPSSGGGSSNNHGSASNSSSPGGNNSGSGTISPATGGTISLSGQVSVTIPKNSLQGSSNASVAVYQDSSSPATTSGFIMLGAVYRMTVNGQEHYVFNSPVTLTFTFDLSRLTPGETPAVYYYDDTIVQWVNIGGTVSGNTITVTVDHFTQYAVMGAEKAAQTPAQKSPAQLTDISGHWAEKSIDKLVSLGAISGYPDGTFRPDSTITRAEFATVLVKAFELQAKSGKVFADTANHWAKDYISTAAAYGILNGYNENTFGPDDPVTREQMAVMSVMAAKLSPANEQLSFSDSGDISAWAKEAVATVVKGGIIKGYPGNTFRPGADATRAEAVTIIINATSK